MSEYILVDPHEQSNDYVPSFQPDILGSVPEEKTFGDRFAEAAGNITSVIPYLRMFPGIGNAGRLYSASNAVKAGDATQEQRRTVYNHVIDQQRDRSFGYKTADIMVNMIPWATEFAIEGMLLKGAGKGFLTAAGAGATKTGAKKLVTQGLIESFAKKATAGTMKRFGLNNVKQSGALYKYAKFLAYDDAVENVWKAGSAWSKARMAGDTALAATLKPAAFGAVKPAIGSALKKGFGRTALSSHMVVENVIKNMTPQYGLAEDQQGKLQFMLADDGDGFLKALYKAYGDVYAENVSESIGENFVILKGLMGPNTSKIMKGVVAGLHMDKAANALVSRGIPLDKAKQMASRWLFGGANKTDGLYHKLGWSGIFNELGEEAVGGIMRQATGITPIGLPSLEDVSAMFVGFALNPLAVGSAVTDTGTKEWVKRHSDLVKNLKAVQANKETNGIADTDSELRKQVHSQLKSFLEYHIKSPDDGWTKLARKMFTTGYHRKEGELISDIAGKMTVIKAKDEAGKEVEIETEWMLEQVSKTVGEQGEISDTAVDNFMTQLFGTHEIQEKHVPVIKKAIADSGLESEQIEDDKLVGAQILNFGRVPVVLMNREVLSEQDWQTLTEEYPFIVNVSTIDGNFDSLRTYTAKDHKFPKVVTEKNVDALAKLLDMNSASEQIIGRTANHVILSKKDLINKVQKRINALKSRFNALPNTKFEYSPYMIVRDKPENFQNRQPLDIENQHKDSEGNIRVVAKALNTKADGANPGGRIFFTRNAELSHIDEEIIEKVVSEYDQDYINEWGEQVKADEAEKKDETDPRILDSSNFELFSKAVAVNVFGIHPASNKDLKNVILNHPEIRMPENVHGYLNSALESFTKKKVTAKSKVPNAWKVIQRDKESDYDYDVRYNKEDKEDFPAAKPTSKKPKPPAQKKQKQAKQKKEKEADAKKKKPTVTKKETKKTETQESEEKKDSGIDIAIAAEAKEKPKETKPELTKAQKEKLGWDKLPSNVTKKFDEWFEDEHQPQEDPEESHVQIEIADTNYSIEEIDGSSTQEYKSFEEMPGDGSLHIDSQKMLEAAIKKVSALREFFDTHSGGILDFGHWTLWDWANDIETKNKKIKEQIKTLKEVFPKHMQSARTAYAAVIPAPFINITINIKTGKLVNKKGNRYSPPPRSNLDWEGANKRGSRQKFTWSYTNVEGSSAPGYIGKSLLAETTQNQHKMFSIVDGVRLFDPTQGKKGKIVGGRTYKHMTPDDFALLREAVYYGFNTMNPNTYNFVLGKYGDKSSSFVIPAPRAIKNESHTEIYKKYVEAYNEKLSDHERKFFIDPASDEFKAMSERETNDAVALFNTYMDLIGSADGFADVPTLAKRLSQALTPGFRLSKEKNYNYVVFDDTYIDKNDNDKEWPLLDGMLFFRQSTFGKDYDEHMGSLLVRPGNTTLVKMFMTFRGDSTGAKKNGTYKNIKPMGYDIDELAKYEFFRNLKKYMDENNVDFAIAASSVKAGLAEKKDPQPLRETAFSIIKDGGIDFNTNIKPEFNSVNGANILITGDYNYSNDPEMKNFLKQLDAVKSHFDGPALRTSIMFQNKASQIEADRIRKTLTLEKIIPVPEDAALDEPNKYGNLQALLREGQTDEELLNSPVPAIAFHANNLLSSAIRHRIAAKDMRTMNTSMMPGEKERKAFSHKTGLDGKRHMVPASIDANVDGAKYTEDNLITYAYNSIEEGIRNLKSNPEVMRQRFPHMFEWREDGKPTNVVKDYFFEERIIDGKTKYVIPGDMVIDSRVPLSSVAYANLAFLDRRIGNSNSSLAMSNKYQMDARSEDADADQTPISVLARDESENLNLDPGTHVGATTLSQIMLMKAMLDHSETVEDFLHLPVDPTLLDKHVKKATSPPINTWVGQEYLFDLMNESMKSLEIAAATQNAFRYANVMRMAFVTNKEIIIDEGLDLVLSRTQEEMDSLTQRDMLEQAHIWNNYLITLFVDDVKNPRIHDLRFNQYTTPLIYAFAFGAPRLKTIEDIQDYLVRISRYFKTNKDVRYYVEELKNGRRKSDIVETLKDRGSSLVDLIKLSGEIASLNKYIKNMYQTPTNYNDYFANDNLIKDMESGNFTFFDTKQLFNPEHSNYFGRVDIMNDTIYDMIFSKTLYETPIARELNPDNAIMIRRRLDMAANINAVQSLAPETDFTKDAVFKRLSGFIKSNKSYKNKEKNRFISMLRTTNYGGVVLMEGGRGRESQRRVKLEEEIKKVIEAFDALPFEVQLDLAASILYQDAAKRRSNLGTGAYHSYYSPAFIAKLNAAKVEELKQWQKDGGEMSVAKYKAIQDLTKREGFDFEYDIIKDGTPAVEVSEQAPAVSVPKNVTKHTAQLISILGNYGIRVGNLNDISGLNEAPVEMRSAVLLDRSRKVVGIADGALGEIGIDRAAASFLVDMASYHEEFFDAWRVIRTDPLVQKMVKEERTKDPNAPPRVHQRAVFRRLAIPLIAHHLGAGSQADGIPSRSTIEKVLEFLRHVIASLRQMLRADSFITLDNYSKHLASVFLSGKDEIRTTVKKGYVQTNLKAMLADTPGSAAVLRRALAAKPGSMLTGSASFAEQGTVYRPETAGLHDIDLRVNNVRTEDIQKVKRQIQQALPNAFLVYDFTQRGFHSLTFLVPQNDRRIKDVSRHTDTPRLTSYKVVDSSGKEVGSYTAIVETHEDGRRSIIPPGGETYTGERAFLVDYFLGDPIAKEQTAVQKSSELVDEEGNVFKVSLVHYSAPFAAKLSYSRFKDIWDYNRFVPYDDPRMIVSEQASRGTGTVTEAIKGTHWDRYSDNGYEVSTKGNEKFSALNAKLSTGETIEHAYQRLKGTGKNQPAKDPNFDYWATYLGLWKQWAKENLKLIEELREASKGKVLTDGFAKTDNSQARALAQILLDTKYTTEAPVSPSKVTEQVTPSDSTAIEQTLAEPAQDTAQAEDIPEQAPDRQASFPNFSMEEVSNDWWNNPIMHTTGWDVLHQEWQRTNNALKGTTKYATTSAEIIMREMGAMRTIGYAVANEPDPKTGKWHVLDMDSVSDNKYGRKIVASFDKYGAANKDKRQRNKKRKQPSAEALAKAAVVARAIAARIENPEATEYFVEVVPALDKFGNQMIMYNLINETQREIVMKSEKLEDVEQKLSNLELSDKVSDKFKIVEQHVKIREHQIIDENYNILGVFEKRQEAIDDLSTDETYPDSAKYNYGYKIKTASIAPVIKEFGADKFNKLVGDVINRFAHIKDITNQDMLSIIQEDWIPTIQHYVSHYYDSALGVVGSESMNILEETKRVERRIFPTFEIAARIAGRTPAYGMNPAKLMDHYAKDITRKAVTKTMVTVGTTAVDMDGSPMWMAKFNLGKDIDMTKKTSITQAQQKIALQNIVDYIEAQLAKENKWAKISTDVKKDPRIEINRLLDEYSTVFRDDGYEVLEASSKFPSIDNWLVKNKIKGDGFMFGSGQYKVLAMLQDAPASWEIAGLDILKGIERFNIWAKSGALALSGFHPFSLLESLVGMGGLTIAGIKKLGMPRSTFNKIQNNFKRLQKNPELIEKWSRHGLQIDVTDPRFDTHVTMMKDPTITDPHLFSHNPNLELLYRHKNLVYKDIQFMKSKNIPLLSSKIAPSIEKYHLWINTYLWSRFFPAIKLHAAETVYGELKENYKQQGKAYDPDKLMSEISKTMNDAFGGQNWDQYIWAVPKVRQALHLLWFAPDWCCDRKTRAITKNGFKYYHELNINDEILIFDPKTKMNRWGNQKDMYVNKNYSGDMVRIKNYNKSIMITPEHTCYVLHDKTRKTSIIKAKELNTHHMIPRCAPMKLTKKETINDRLIRIIGWMVTNGYIRYTSWRITKNGNKKRYSYGGICQNKPNGIKDINKLGLTYYTEPISHGTHGKYKNNRLINRYYVPAKEMREAESLGIINNKLSYEFLSLLSERQLRLLKKTMMLGDGTGQHRFCGKEKEIFNMTMLQTMLGEPTTFYQQEEHCWRTRTISSKNITCAGNRKKTIHYEGTIWCPSVETGFWVAEREGLMFITGNTLSAFNIAGASNVPGIRQIIRENQGSVQRKVELQRYWPAMAAIVMYGIPQAIQASIWAVSKALPGPDDDESTPFIAMNEAGKRGLGGFGAHIDITPILKKFGWVPLIGYKGGKTGKRRVYLRWGKQATEVFEGWAGNSIQTAMNKTSVAVRTAFEQLFQINTAGWGMGFQDKGITGLVSGEKGLWDSRLASVVKKFVPMSLLSMMEGRPSTFFAPASRGISNFAAQKRMAEILMTYADKGSYDVLMAREDYKVNLESLGNNIMDRAVINGISPESVLTGAKRHVLSHYYSEFFKALNAKNSFKLERIANSILRLNSKLKNVEKSMKLRYKDASNREYSAEKQAVVRRLFGE